jgi:hypothetical protein
MGRSGIRNGDAEGKKQESKGVEERTDYKIPEQFDWVHRSDTVKHGEAIEKACHTARG